MKCEGENWIQVEKNAVKLRAVVNTRVRFQIQLKSWEFFPSSGTIKSEERTYNAIR
jgi:hypothetical protein